MGLGELVVVDGGVKAARKAISDNGGQQERFRRREGSRRGKGETVGRDEPAKNRSDVVLELEVAKAQGGEEDVLFGVLVAEARVSLSGGDRTRKEVVELTEPPQ